MDTHFKPILLFSSLFKFLKKKYSDWKLVYMISKELSDPKDFNC